MSCGIPRRHGTLPLVETGVAVVGEYPDIGNFWMTTNNPCDANMMDNNAMYRELSANGKKSGASADHAPDVRRPYHQGAGGSRAVRGH